MKENTNEKFVMRPVKIVNDVLPPEHQSIEHIRDAFKESAKNFNCSRIDTPIFENIKYLKNGLEKKAIYEIKGLEKDGLFLRPEITTGVLRAHFNNLTEETPVLNKYYYDGPIFIHSDNLDEPGINHQFGVEFIGDESPLIDSALIVIVYNAFKKMALADKIIIDLNVTGCSTCRGKINKKISDYLEKFSDSICEDCNKKIKENPLKVFDCKNKNCYPFTSDAPQAIDIICPDCKSHFMQVLESLDNLQIPYNLNPRLTRDFDYYSRTIFEIFDIEDTKKENCLAGGGRYDRLAKNLGFKSVPAVGFASNLNNIIKWVKEKESKIAHKQEAQVCLVQIGEKAQKKCLSLLIELEDAGFKTITLLGKDSLKTQLKTSASLRSDICIILGQREVIDNTAIVRDMKDGSQETVRLDQLIDILKEKIK